MPKFYRKCKTIEQDEEHLHPKNQSGAVSVLQMLPLPRLVKKYLMNSEEEIGPTTIQQILRTRNEKREPADDL